MPKEGNIIFPRDAGEHWDEEVEWWYLNANVSTSKGTKLNLFICFLRDKILLMINDLTNGQSLRRAIIPGSLNHTSSSRMNLHSGENWWRDNNSNLFEQSLHLNYKDIIIDLKINSLKPPSPLNLVGLTSLGLLGSSWYYSLTRLDVRGSLEIDGIRESISGVGWFDRQWGTWEWCGMGGWKWFAIQLNDDTEIMLMNVTHPLTNQIIKQILNIIPPDSKVKVINGFKVKTLGKWKSSTTGVTYDKGWILSSESFTIKVIPFLEDQEMYGGMWEGSCLVEGFLDGHSVTGTGFVEQYNTQIHANKLLTFIYLGAAIPRYILRMVLGSNRYAHIRSIKKPWRLNISN